MPVPWGANQPEDYSFLQLYDYINFVGGNVAGLFNGGGNVSTLALLFYEGVLLGSSSLLYNLPS